MKTPLAQRVKIVAEALLSGRIVEMAIGGDVYRLGMSEDYSVLIEAKNITDESVKFLRFDMTVKLFFEAIGQMDVKDIQLIAAENALKKIRINRL